MNQYLIEGALDGLWPPSYNPPSLHFNNRGSEGIIFHSGNVSSVTNRFPPGLTAR